MSLSSKVVLHVVDMGAGYIDAPFLDVQTVKEMWKTFLDIWMSTYGGFPDQLRVDHGTQFQPTQWNHRTTDARFIMRPTEIESHYLLGIE